MRNGVVVALACCLSLVAGCIGQTKTGKLQEAAQNLNVATRFGRMDVAHELVAHRSMTDFTRRHQTWGRSIRLIDLEVQGIQFVNKNEAAVSVMVGWQRADEQELRTTQLLQMWTYDTKGWLLVDESRAGGDIGLLGEQIEVLRPEREKNVHFQSVTIR